MSATTLARRAATALTATALAVPAVGAFSGSAFATQPVHHANGAAQAHASDHSASSRGATSAKNDPTGNNGTVFIHDVAGDNRPHNVPHVGCTFYVDFFGFDSGQMLSTSFVAQAPPAAGTPLPSGDWTGTMPANGASGAGRDFDAEQAFTLDTSALGAPQAQQGYHVKLTVSTGEPGGVKHKVFWISGCARSVAGTAAGSDTAENTASVAGSPHSGSVAGDRTASHTHRAHSESAPRVLGLTVTRQLPAGVTHVFAVSADRTPSALPFTGAAGIGALLAIAGLALAAGGALVVAGRVGAVSG